MRKYKIDLNMNCEYKEITASDISAAVSRALKEYKKEGKLVEKRNMYIKIDVERLE